MTLQPYAPVCFVPTRDADTARSFYEQSLGLPFVTDDGFALVFRLGVTGSMLRIVRVQDFEPFPFTLLGWEVPNIEQAVDDLVAKGIKFLSFPLLEQDQRGIWRTPGGSTVAWFKDPDGHTLSLSAHERALGSDSSKIFLSSGRKDTLDHSISGSSGSHFAVINSFTGSVRGGKHDDVSQA